MTEVDNHLRRMWGIVNGACRYAKPGDHRAHAQWFDETGICAYGDQHRFEQLVRGFYHAGELHAYRGRNFVGNGRVLDTIIPHLPLMQKIIGMRADTEIYLGFNRQIYVGTIGENLE